MRQVIIYTDGSSRGNPGPGGYGTIIQYRDDDDILYEKELSGGFTKTTNNRMEILAAIVGLEHLTEPCQVTIISDSKYLVNTFQKRWIQGWEKNGWRNWKGVPVKNPDLWKRMLAAMKGHDVKFKWVKGHNEHPENERCDKLAVKAAETAKVKDRLE